MISPRAAFRIFPDVPMVTTSPGSSAASGSVSYFSATSAAPNDDESPYTTPAVRARPLQSDPSSLSAQIAPLLTHRSAWVWPFEMREFPATARMFAPMLVVPTPMEPERVRPPEKVEVPAPFTFRRLESESEV